MKRVVGWVTVAVLAGASALPSLAETAPSGEPWGAPLSAVLASSLERAGVPSALAAQAVASAAAPDDERAFPFLFEAGDLDGDGAADVVALSTAAGPAGAEPVTTVQARRGADGAVLWTRTVSGRAGLVPVPAATGRAGEPGVLLVGYEQFAAGGSFNGAPGETPLGFGDVGVGVALEVVSLGGDGSLLWSRRYADGLFAYNGTTLALVRALPILGGLLTSPAAPTDVLVQLYDRAPEGPTTQADTVTTLVLDGAAAGAETGRVVTDVSGARAQVRVAPDLDGDGGQDYVLAVNGANEEVPDAVTARRAGTGSVLWTVPASGLQPARFRVHALGDSTGDGRSELALSSGDLPAATTGQPDAAVRTLDGATGALLRTVPGQRADVAGDVDRDGALDLLVSRVRREGAVSTTDVRVVSTRTGAVTGGSISLTTAGTAQALVTEQGLVGDLDGDGLQDLLVTLAGNAVTPGPQATAVFSGRTAQVLRSTPLDGLPLGGSADGTGDDLYRVTSFGDSVRDLTVVDGLSGLELRTVRLRPRGDVTNLFSVDALGAPGRARLVVNTQGRVADSGLNPDVERTSTDTTVVDSYVLDAVDGTRRWQTDLDGVPPRPAFTGAATVGSPFSWTGSPRTGFAVASGSGACAATDPQQRCERTLIEVRADAGTSRSLTVDVGQFSPVAGPATDLDLRVLSSDAAGTIGPELGSSGRGALDETYDERVTVPLAFGPSETSRWVLAEVVYFTSAETGYRGTASVSAAP